MAETFSPVSPGEAEGFRAPDLRELPQPLPSDEVNISDPEEKLLRKFENLERSPIVTLEDDAVIEGFLEMDFENWQVNPQLLDLVALKCDLLAQGVFFDEKTGLPNRNSIIRQAEKLEEERRENPEGNGRTVFLLLDLGKFGELNRTYGDAVGDRALEHIGQTLRQHDIVCRYAGDEFFAMAHNLQAAGENETSPEQLIAERISESLRSNPFVIDAEKGLYYDGGVSIGTAEYDPNLGFIGTLNRADASMYYGKHNTPEGQDKIARYEEIESLLEQNEEERFASLDQLGPLKAADFARLKHFIDKSKDEQVAELTAHPELVSEYQVLLKTLHRLYYFDASTGLYNRNILRREVEKERRGESSFSTESAAFLLRIDGLKMINDNYGHEKGDEALREFGQLLSENVRSESGDVAVRYAGNEFVILANTADQEKSQGIINRLYALAQETFVTVPSAEGESRIPLTFYASGTRIGSEGMVSALEKINPLIDELGKGRKEGSVQNFFYWQGANEAQTVNLDEMPGSAGLE